MEKSDDLKTLSQLILNDESICISEIIEEIKNLYNPSDISTCMCGKEEIEYRSKCGMISIFEICNPEHADIRNPKTTIADALFCIKKYERSQGEFNEIIPRSLSILHLCFMYISLEIIDCYKNESSRFYNAINQFEDPIIKTYDFVSDRFRCIVQDLTVLNDINHIQAVKILEGIIRYYLWADYSLKGVAGFDSVLNIQKAMNCFTLLFEGYKQNEENCTNRLEFLEYLIIIYSNDTLSFVELCAELSKTDIKEVMPLIKSINCSYKKYCKYISKIENKPLLKNLMNNKTTKMKILIESIKASIRENHSEIQKDGQIKKSLKFKITSKSFKDIIQKECDLEQIANNYDLIFE